MACRVLWTELAWASMHLSPPAPWVVGPALEWQVGEMNDAGEVLLTIYERIRALSPGAAAVVDASFGLHVSESVHCSACKKVTHLSEYTQYFFNTQVGGVVGCIRCGRVLIRVHALPVAWNDRPRCSLPGTSAGHRASPDGRVSSPQWAGGQHGHAAARCGEPAPEELR